MENFYDVYEKSLKKHNEELCGDTVKISKQKDRTIVVLSDGLGSGVKANILATLTAEIVSTLLNNNVELNEVIKTIIATLPMCKVRKLAYATFSVMDIDESTNTFKVINSENPPIFHMREGRIIKPVKKEENVLGRKVTIYEGSINRGDFIGMASDGVLYAGLGKVMNFGWGWENIAQYMEESFAHNNLTCKDIVSSVIDHTERLYRGEIGDDSTFVGMYAREMRKLIIFTGPPVDKAQDHRYINEFMSFEGERVICGGTTANLVSEFMNEKIETDITNLSPDIPPIGRMTGVNLVTEGIVTLAKVIEYLKKGPGQIDESAGGRNGAALLLNKLLSADYIQFLVGQTVNPYYQNPLLPRNLSIRVSLIRELSELLSGLRKEVAVTLC